MSRPMVRWTWTAAALAALIPLGLVALPAVAQYGGKPSANSVSQAKEMATLIEQGQLNLRDATGIAEKHIKGTALGAMCRLEAAKPEPVEPPRAPAEPPREPPRRGPAAQKEQPEGKRLIYDVSCFAADKLQMVRVDGLTKKVIDVTETK